MPDQDYSATPLGTKLGAKPGVEVLLFLTTSRASATIDGEWQAVRFVYRKKDRAR